MNRHGVLGMTGQGVSAGQAPARLFGSFRKLRLGVRGCSVLANVLNLPTFLRNPSSKGPTLSQIHSHPSATSLATAAGLVLAVGSTAAHGAIVSSTVPVDALPGVPVSNIGGFDLTLSNQFNPNGAGFNALVGAGFYNGNGLVHKASVAAGTDVASLDFAGINAASTLTLLERDYDSFTGAYSAPIGKMSSTSGGQSYFAFTFDQGVGARYGWFEVTVADNGEGNAFGATLNGWGFEDSGKTIEAGQVTSTAVPEPGTLVLAAAGLALAGSATRRHRRRQKA